MTELRCLLTGFGPFPGVEDNPTARLARSLDAQVLRAPGVQVSICAEVWPVDAQALPGLLDEALERWAPQLVVHLGVASEAVRPRLEHKAWNRLEFRVPDVAGWQPQAQVISAGLEPDAPLQTPADLQDLQRDLALAGHTVDLSDDPGRYVCNLCAFLSLQRAVERGMASLFVHVPPSPDAASDAQLEATVQRLVLRLAWQRCGAQEVGEGRHPRR